MPSTIATAGIATILALAPAVAADKLAELRLMPLDIAALPSTGADTGTSGVAGIRTTVLSGDPEAAGPYTIALRVPANTQIAAHSHRDARSAVVSGTWWFGYGVRASTALFHPLSPGSFYTEPAGLSHFARTGGQPVLVYITGSGPTDTRYETTGIHPLRP